MGWFDFFKKASDDSAQRQPQVFSRSEVMREHSQESPRQSGETFDAMFGRDNVFDEIAELNRRATALGDAGRLDEAVSCLKRVVELNKAAIYATPSEGLRLALYLQKAGRGAEAIEEVRKLIAMVPAAVDSNLSNGKPSSQGNKAHFEADQYSELYDKLRLILQREKMKSECDECRQLAQQWRDRASALYQRQVMNATVDVPARPPLSK